MFDDIFASYNWEVGYTKRVDRCEGSAKHPAVHNSLRQDVKLAAHGLHAVHNEYFQPSQYDRI